MAEKVVIPWELKYDFAMRGYAGIFKGFMYEYREKHGAAATLEFYEGVWKRDDRVKNLTLILKDIFKIDGNDIKAIQKWYDIFFVLMGWEYTSLEQSQTLYRVKIPVGCSWKTMYKDVSDWILIWFNIVVKTINPKATVEHPKGMCAGDPYCEYIIKVEE